MVNTVISIVIPAFNEEKLLPLCLESLKSQNHQGSYEIIVVDNASTDGTARIAAEFGAKVVSCPKRGVAYARQAGAQTASGDIIVQADADTIYPEDWLSRIASYFASHPRTVALAGSYVYKDPPFWAAFEYIARYLINILGLLLLGRPVCISGANFAFRREAFLKTNGYNPESLYPDQWGISRSLSQVGKIYYDTSVLVFTSTRRVQMPFHLIVLSIALNSSRIFAHFIRHSVNLSRTLAARLSPLKALARRTALILLIIITCLFVYGYVAPRGQVFGKPVTIAELLKITGFNQ